MRANEVRQAILKTIEDILREHSESHSVTDEAIAEALGLELQLTRDHLELMQQDDYVNVIKTFGGWSASLTAKGRLTLKDTIIDRELAKARENLRLIRARKSEYVLEVDVPLQLIKEEQRCLERLEGLERPVETLGEKEKPEEPRLASLYHQLAEARENLRLIRARKSKYVLEVEGSLQLVKEEKRWLERIEELERRIEILERTLQQQPARREVLSPAYLAQLLQVLDERFNEDELQTLCFCLDIDYDNLSGEGKSGKARELIRYLRRRTRILDLVETGKGVRPDIPWPEVVNDG